MWTAILAVFNMLLGQSQERKAEHEYNMYQYDKSIRAQENWIVVSQVAQIIIPIVVVILIVYLIKKYK